MIKINANDKLSDGFFRGWNVKKLVTPKGTTYTIYSNEKANLTSNIPAVSFDIHIANNGGLTDEAILDAATTYVAEKATDVCFNKANIDPKTEKFDYKFDFYDIMHLTTMPVELYVGKTKCLDVTLEKFSEASTARIYSVPFKNLKNYETYVKSYANALINYSEQLEKASDEYYETSKSIAEFISSKTTTETNVKTDDSKSK